MTRFSLHKTNVTLEQPMLDVRCELEDHVEVEVRADRNVLWVNINGVTVLRVSNINSDRLMTNLNK